MALIKCTECGREISSKAAKCPNCGCPVNEAENARQVSNDIRNEATVSPKMNYEEQVFNQRVKKTAHVNKKLIILVALICVIAAVIFAVIQLRPCKHEWKAATTLEPKTCVICGETEGKPLTVMDTGETVDNTKTVEDTPVNPENLPTQIEYEFIDHTEFTRYWYDGVFRCGTDFAPGDYYILPLFGAGALYDVANSPDDFSWSYYRLLRKVNVQTGEYIRVCHDAIMVPADEVDTDNWAKYGVFLVGRDILAGDYKMETIHDEYHTDITWITGIDGAYQLNNHNVIDDPIDSGYLFESQNYITLEEGQYIIITNIRLSNVNVANSEIREQTTRAESDDTSNINECPLEFITQKFTGTEDAYSYATFTIKNISGKTINTLTLDIKLLDEDGTVVSTTHPQEGVRISNNECIVIEAMAENGTYAMKLDGYSFYTGNSTDGEYISGYFSDIEQVLLDDEKQTDTPNALQTMTDNRDSKELLTINGCFTYTPRSFMERLDEADKELDGYNYAYMRANGEESLYYELADIEGGYDYVHSVGVVAFSDCDGNDLSIDDDSMENSIGSVTVLVADIDDVAALLVCSMCAADPSLDFMTAYNIGGDVIASAETAEGYTYNGVNYVITETDDYYCIIISTDSSANAPDNKNSGYVETTEYELNFAEFCVPDYFEHTETDGNVMWFQNGENNRMMVEIAEIPDYMKIDTGNGNAITSAKDVVEFYTYAYEDNTISEGWVRLWKFDCYEKVFSVDTDTGVRKGRSIVIPINENEGVIVILALCEDEECLLAVDNIIESMQF